MTRPIFRRPSTPLRSDGQSAGGEQWFAFATLMCLLI
jgi:hypothetical protein